MDCFASGISDGFIGFLDALLWAEVRKDSHFVIVLEGISPGVTDVQSGRPGDAEVGEEQVAIGMSEALSRPSHHGQTGGQGNSRHLSKGMPARENERLVTPLNP